jgi:hypothetical protein
LFLGGTSGIAIFSWQPEKFAYNTIIKNATIAFLLNFLCSFFETKLPVGERRQAPSFDRQRSNSAPGPDGKTSMETNMKKFLRATTFAVALLGSGVALAPITSAQAEDFGAWTTVRYHGSAGLETFYPDGSTVLLARVGDEIHLLLSHPTWHFSSGRHVPVNLAIDNQTYEGAGEAIDSTTLDLGADTDFVADFMMGSYGSLTVLGSRWPLDLTGTFAAGRSIFY